MSEISEKPPKTKMMDRREFLRNIAVVAAGTAIPPLVLTACGEETPSPEPTTATQQPEAEPEPRPMSGLKEMYSEENTPHLNYIQSQAEEFMDYHPQDEARRKKEIALFQSLEQDNATPSDILLALQATAHPDARYIGLDLLWQKRQRGDMEKFGFKALPPDKVKWAEEHGISPLMLAIAEDCMPMALEIMNANLSGKDSFLEALPDQKIQEIKENNLLTYHLPNPGVIAKLLMTETAGWKNIGTEPAITQINDNPELFPAAEKALQAIASLISQTIPYKEHLHTLPGSHWPKDSLSGGAIGPQMMPDNALSLMNKYNKGNQKLDQKYPFPNPFDVYIGTIFASLFIASECPAEHAVITENGRLVKEYENIIRVGYRAGNPVKMEKALGKWNPDSEQYGQALDAGYDYHDEFWGENDPRQAWVRSLGN